MKSLTIGGFCFVFSLFQFINASAVERPTVELTQGRLTGKYIETISKRKISAFIGIPFAKPPIGDLRFSEPVPATPWAGVLNATRDPPACLQVNLFWKSQSLTSGSEDCLYLNVYVPEDVEKHLNRRLEVVVNIHGGAFISLSGIVYGPEYLLDRDVILVTLNYRLGVLGFLSTGDTVVPGNNGLKDQQLALKWVQQNIKSFGGDPTKVTLTGESAGGASAHYHVLSSSSKGLFSRAMMLSGSALCSWAQTENVKEKSKMIGAQLGCPTDDSKSMVECLKQRPADHIVELTILFFKWMIFPFTPFGPIIETTHPNAFIDKSPSAIITNKLANDVPLLFSLTSAEGLFPGAAIFAENKNIEMLEEGWNKLIPHLLDFNYTVDPTQQATVAKIIRLQYLGNDKINDNKKGFIKMLSDRIFNLPLAQTAKLHAMHSKSPVHSMQFSYYGNNRVSNFYVPRDFYEGAGHGDDLIYVLRTQFMILDKDESAMIMSKRMIDLWMDFIKGTSFPSKWLQLKDTLPDYSYLNIASADQFEDTFIKQKDFARESFWVSLDFNEDDGFQRKNHIEL